jgi:hypothetical protein
MRAFLATVLSVIAVGVLLIGYGLISPRLAAAPAAPAGVVQYDARGDAYQLARPMFASERVDLANDPYAARTAAAYPANSVRPASYDPYSVNAPAPARRVVASAPSTSSSRSTRVERSSGRDWTKTAMVIGGTTAAGAGIGAIFGGKKGALIGAALGGGAGTLYEVKKQ